MIRKLAAPLSAALLSACASTVDPGVDVRCQYVTVEECNALRLILNSIFTREAEMIFSDPDVQQHLDSVLGK